MLETAGRFFAVGNFSTLVDRAEGLEIKELNSGAGTSRVVKGADNALIDSILVLVREA
jgi:hypothetical protein